MRLISSLIPFNQKFYQMFNEKPDLYGPFWILTTLVVLITISGNLAMWMDLADSKDFKYSFTMIPVATSILFGLAVGIPLGIKMAITLLGEGSSAVPLMHGVGIYSYSYSSFLISTILCGAIHIEWVQWILICYSGITSVVFLA